MHRMVASAVLEEALWAREDTLTALPYLPNESSVEAFMDDMAASSAALGAIARAAGITGPLTRPERGSAIIGLGETEVLKAMAPIDARLSLIERQCLLALDGQLRSSGELGGSPARQGLSREPTGRIGSDGSGSWK